MPQPDNSGEIISEEELNKLTDLFRAFEGCGEPMSRAKRPNMLLLKWFLKCTFSASKAMKDLKNGRAASFIASFVTNAASAWIREARHIPAYQINYR